MSYPAASVCRGTCKTLISRKILNLLDSLYSRRKRPLKYSAVMGVTMTLDLVDFQQSIFQERALFTRVCIISGSGILRKAIICSLQEYRVCVSGVQADFTCKNYIYMQVHIIQWHASASTDSKDGDSYYDARIRAALDGPSSWFKQITSRFTCLCIHALVFIYNYILIISVYSYFLEFRTFIYLYLNIFKIIYVSI